MNNWKESEGGRGMLGRVVRGLGGLTRMRELVLKLTAVACPLMLVLHHDACLGQGPGAPDVIPYQGTLVNADGGALGAAVPVNYDLVFRIFDAPSGGVLLWSEQQTVTVDAGRFSVQLGMGGAVGTEPRPSLGATFRTSTASDRYLETTVKAVGPGQSDSTLSPRSRLLPGPYAILGRHARTAGRIVNSSRGGVMTIRGAQVGINTTNPATTLDVAGSTRAQRLQLSGNGRVLGAATAGGWVGGGAAPVGSIILWSGTAVDKPQGWAFCDGTVVDGYRTPDLRGRFVLGAGAGPGLSARTVGATGGAETHNLTLEEMPTHAHTLFLWGWAGDTGDHQHTVYSEVGSPIDSFPRESGVVNHYPPGGMIGGIRHTLRTSDSGAHVHSLDLPETPSSFAGSGQPHPNMPPFYVLAYLVRVK